jgi:hypothetical protein
MRPRSTAPQSRIPDLVRGWIFVKITKVPYLFNYIKASTETKAVVNRYVFSAVLCPDLIIVVRGELVLPNKQLENQIL